MAKRFVKRRLRGYWTAKRRKIKRYRMITPRGRPDIRIRIAVVSRRGPRGGRTVATSKLRRVR